jgi:hypothetical protein
VLEQMEDCARYHTYFIVSQNYHPVVNLLRQFVARFARCEHIEFDHARLIIGLFILFLLVGYAFGDACDNRDGDHRASEEEPEWECHRGFDRGSSFGNVLNGRLES